MVDSQSCNDCTQRDSRRVVLIASSFHPHTGGVEEHVRHVARGLRARGHQVVVWTVDRGEHLGQQIVEGVLARYLPTPLPARSARAVLRFLFALPVAIRAWSRAVREDRPDIVHVQCYGPNGTYAFLMSRACRLPLVVSSHGETFADDHAVFDESVLQRQSLRRAIACAATVTGCSEEVLDDLRLRFGLKGGEAVPNGVDLSCVAAEAKSADRPVVLAVGRVETMKGFDVLLRAFAAAELPSGARLEIAGVGSQVSNLRQIAQSLGLDGHVSFLGRLTSAEVARHMASASAVVIPSRREAFGLVLLEAWRAGTPVIASDTGGPRDLVEHGRTGLLVPVEDEEALADAIATVLNDAPLAAHLAEAGLAEVRRYPWDAVVERYEALYERVLTGRA